MENISPAPYVRRVNYYETDQMGIVHHANYFRYFEEARMDFMRQMNCSALELENRGVIIPNVDAYAKFIKLMRYDDVFSIKVIPASFTGAKMKFEYEVTRDGELCCTGHTTHCFVDENMRPISIKRVCPDVYTRLTEIFPAA